MKINDTLTPFSQTTGSTTVVSEKNASGVAQSNSASPAASVDIALSSKASQIQSSKQASATDQALIEKIRNQIASGQFKIDYSKISRAMITDLASSLGHKNTQSSH